MLVAFDRFEAGRKPTPFSLLFFFFFFFFFSYKFLVAVGFCNAQIDLND